MCNLQKRCRGARGEFNYGSSAPKRSWGGSAVLGRQRLQAGVSAISDCHGFHRAYSDAEVRVANLITGQAHLSLQAGIPPTRALHQDRCGSKFRTQTHAPLALCIKTLALLNVPDMRWDKSLCTLSVNFWGKFNHAYRCI